MDGQHIEIRQGMAAIEPGVAPHYAVAGTGERTVVLLHGFLGGRSDGFPELGPRALMQ